MQKLMTVLGLLLSITGTLCAQENNHAEMTTEAYKALSPDERLFTPWPYSFGIDYTIILDRGNKLRIELANGYDLHTFENIDSLLMVFLGDLKSLRDSLSDPMTVKRIDYLIDTSGHKKLRIHQYRPPGTSFLVDGNEPALLKIQQDTIYIMLVRKVARYGQGKTKRGLRYDRLCFFLNRYSELDAYVASGLNETIHGMLSDYRAPHHVYTCPFCYTINKPTIKSHLHYGNALMLNASVAIQNYRNYFAPSFTLNSGVVLNRGSIRYIFRAYWEPLFFFSTNAQGQSQVFRNDWVGVGFEAVPPENPNGLQAALSFSWLAHSEGNYFNPKPAFRLSPFLWQHGPFHIGPALYFDRFFKNVTPSIRFSFLGF
jgi:hypothetical protein